MSIDDHENMAMPDLDSDNFSSSTNADECSLNSILNNLPVSTRNDLFDILKSLHDSSHIYHNQWGALHPNDGFIEKSYELVRRYESNGLQLDGYGCWLFEKVLVRARHRISECTRYPPSDILELTLRIMLEHKCFLSCKNILVEVVADSAALFKEICLIGEYIWPHIPFKFNFVVEKCRHQNCR